MSGTDQPSGGKPSSRTGRLILALTSVVMIAVAIVMVVQRQPTAKGPGDISQQGVQLTITAPHAGTPVTIDGAMAGRTPIVMRVKGGPSRTMTIEGNGVRRQIVLDRDQTVELVAP